MPQTQAEWKAFAASTTEKAQQLAQKVDAGARTHTEQSEQIARMADDLRTVRARSRRSHRPQCRPDGHARRHRSRAGPEVY